MKSDPRCIPGTAVTAKAIHVTSKAECSRRYGAQAKTYVVSGVVVKVVEKNLDGSNRRSKVVFVDFDFGDGVVKRRGMGLRSLTLVPSLEQGLAVEVPHNRAESLELRQLVTDFDREIEVGIQPNVDDLDATIHETSTVEAEICEGEGEDDEDIRTMEVEEVEHPPSPPLRRSPRRQAPNAILGEATPMVAEAHEYKWYLDPSHIMFDVRGPVRYREWGIRTVTGDILHAGCNLEGRFSRLEIFLMMFPPRALESILEATNQQLHLCNKRRTTRQEL